MFSPAIVVNNIIRSFILIALLFAIVFGLVFVGAWLVEGVRISFKSTTMVTSRATADLLWLTPWIVLVTVAWIGVALVFAGYMIRWSSGCRLVEPGTEPRLEGILKRLCAKAQIDVPQLGIMETNELNAYATGLFKSDHLVAVTRGLMQKLNDEEIEGVLAHELAHIKNRDVLLSVMAGTVAGGIALLADLLYFGILRSVGVVVGLFGDSDDEESGSPIAVWAALCIGFVFVLISSLVATLIGFALSRSREYLADAGAAEMTGNPRALMTALEKITEDCDIPAPSGVMQMCIDRPRGVIDLFSTHPRTEDRIAALRGLPQRASAARVQPQRVQRAGVPSTLAVRAQFGQRGR